MSKASEWAKADPGSKVGGLRARPVFRWKGTRYAVVYRNFNARKRPTLYVMLQTVPNVAVLALARWINDTFGEESSA